MRAVPVRFECSCNTITDDRLCIMRDVIGLIKGIVNFCYYTTVKGGLSEVSRMNTRILRRRRRNQKSTIINQEATFTNKTTTQTYDIYFYFPYFIPLLLDSLSSIAPNV